jgi:hypothetical protein
MIIARVDLSPGLPCEMTYWKRVKQYCRRKSIQAIKNRTKETEKAAERENVCRRARERKYPVLELHGGFNPARLSAGDRAIRLAWYRVN